MTHSETHDTPLWLSRNLMEVLAQSGHATTPGTGRWFSKRIFEILGRNNPLDISHLSIQDLTKGNPESHQNATLWQQRVDILYSQIHFSESNVMILQTPRKLINALSVTEGPPGASNTLLCAYLMWLFVGVVHKVALMTQRDRGVDLCVNAAMMAKADFLKDKNCLRLEKTCDDFLIFISVEDPWYHHEMAKICTEYQEDAEEHNNFERHIETYGGNCPTYLRETRKTRAGIPVSMTLSHRVWELTQRDRADAENDIQSRRNLLRPDSPKDIDNAPSLDDLDKSFRYRSLLMQYMATEGELTQDQHQAFRTARNEILARVMQETDVLFSTLHDSGCKCAKSGGFRPSVLICDEANECTFSAFAIPLTSWNSWKGVFLFGERKQPEPR